MITLIRKAGHQFATVEHTQFVYIHSHQGVTVTKPQSDDLEAVRTIVAALEGFDAKDKERILRWAREKLGLAQHSSGLPSPAATDANLLVTPPTALPGHGS